MGNTKEIPEQLVRVKHMLWLWAISDVLAVKIEMRKVPKYSFLMSLQNNRGIEEIQSDTLLEAMVVNDQLKV